jgi:intein-encoded DNA endonuclease-like protein
MDLPIDNRTFISLNYDYLPFILIQGERLNIVAELYTADVEGVSSLISGLKQLCSSIAPGNFYATKIKICYDKRTSIIFKE